MQACGLGLKHIEFTGIVEFDEIASVAVRQDDGVVYAAAVAGVEVSNFEGCASGCFDRIGDGRFKLGVQVAIWLYVKDSSVFECFVLST